MDKIYNRMRRLLPVATNEQTTEQHPKNRAFQISFVELLFFSVEIWSLAIMSIKGSKIFPEQHSLKESHFQQVYHVSTFSIATTHLKEKKSYIQNLLIYLVFWTNSVTRGPIFVSELLWYKGDFKCQFELCLYFY